MNIFATSRDPNAAARALDDKRVVKMIAETTQMLCTAARTNGYKVKGPKSTHENHPCTVWVGETSGNFRWALAHLRALHEEKSYRWPKNKPHAYQPVYVRLANVLVEMEAGGLVKRARSPFVNCARNAALALDYTWIEDTREAYRQYLMSRWLRSQPGWTRRGPPKWANSFAPMEDSI